MVTHPSRLPRFCVLPQGERGLSGADGWKGERGEQGLKGEKVSNGDGACRGVK